MNIPTKRLKKFHLNYLKSEGCWNWLSAKGGSTRNYGVFSISGKQRYAHRIMWELTNGRSPEDLEVCHSCDNPSCVNPEHLFLATHKENFLDAKKKRRMASGLRHGLNLHPQRRTVGERNGMAMLTVNDVKEIRRLYKPRRGVSELAKRFGIKPSVIWKVANYRSWKHV